MIGRPSGNDAEIQWRDILHFNAGKSPYFNDEKPLYLTV
jgi:hypothetical protein